MCGIAGYWGNQKALRKQQFPHALSQQKHRGPDHTGIYEDDHLLLGHNRLSIVDLSPQANQPMLSPCGKFAIVFNGELFNYRSLIDQFHLQPLTHSDTEVALLLLQAMGENALTYFNGFFALAFYEVAEKRLLLARDRYGEKPLWYSHQQNSEFFFASEAKIFDAFELRKTLDVSQLYAYLQYSYIPAPNSIFKEYKKLLPGHFIKISNHQVSEPTAWYHEQKTSSSPLYLQEVLLDAVDIRLNADVPVGAFLSGGIDSSFIAAIAIRQKSDLKTFTLSFPEEAYYNEAQAAELVAKHIGSNHITLPVTTEDVRAQLSCFVESLDEPFADSSSLAVLLLSGEMKKHVTVALGGDAADELFGGYRKHRALILAEEVNPFSRFAVHAGAAITRNLASGRSNRWNDRIRQLHKLSKGLSQNSIERYHLWTAWNEERWISSLLPGVRPTDLDIPADVDFLKWDQHMVLPNDMLVKLDLMSMQHALEVRSPFLDYRVVEAANSMGLSTKVDQHEGKKVLRQLAKDYLPMTILDRPKKGFEVPIETWLKGAWKSEWLDCLTVLKQDPHLNAVALEQINQAFMKGQGELASLVFALMVYARWSQK